MQLTKIQKRKKIHMRIRKSLVGTAQRPRFCVYRSNKSTYCQIIDDNAGRTLLSASTSDKDVNATGTKTEQAKALGLAIGKKIQAQNIEQIVFDRNGYLYHGRVKALAEGLREAGIKV